MLTDATHHKRQQLHSFIEQKLAPQPAVQAVVGVGSIATGRAHAGSDIDAVLFLDPLDLYIVPAESLWRAADDSFHSIFTDDAELQQTGLPLDFKRVDVHAWRAAAYVWPEPMRAELASGWLAFDRTGDVTRLIAMRTAYDDTARIPRLDEAITWLDQHLGEDGPQVRWDTLGPTLAHDRLHAAYAYLVQALFAYNRQWRTWRNREMMALLQLPWLPAHFGERVLVALNARRTIITAIWRVRRCCTTCFTICCTSSLRMAPMQRTRLVKPLCGRMTNQGGHGIWTPGW